MIIKASNGSQTKSELRGRKARWDEFLQEFDCTLRYCKGRYSVVTNALSPMLEIESLSFTELRSDLLTSLRGKCEHDPVYSKVWNMVKRRDPSPLDVYDANSTQGSSPSCDELN